MNRSAWKHWAVYIGAAEAVGALAGLLIRPGVEYYTQNVQKPALSPPPTVFPIVWAVLYALMGVGAARVSQTEPPWKRTRALRLWWVQLAFNFCWSVLFFLTGSYGLAFLWLVVLWVLILSMTLAFREADRLAAWLQVPYVLWVLFAGYLNFGVWMLNR